MLSDKEIDWLAREGCDMIGFRPGQPVSYDLAGFDRVERHEVAPGSFPTKDAPTPAKIPLPEKAKFEDNPYLVRLGGFRRNNLFGPDEIGKLISDYGIVWNDGLGNGMLESLLINRKYGLRQSIEAPALGFTVPFTKEEWSAFQEYYPKRIAGIVSRLKEIEAVYGGPLVQRELNLSVLFCQETALSLFAAAFERNPQAVKKELITAIGCEKPIIDPKTSEERVALAKFWVFIQHKHAQVLEFQARTLRTALGSGVKIVGNNHELPPIDFEGFGRVYDYPGVAIRPTLLIDEIMLRHYTGFCVQLVRDLTKKTPLVSVRVNLLAAGCRFMPCENLIRTWYDQAIRHGAGGFYFWTRDYPSSLKENPYDGPMVGNPDPSTLPQVRWGKSLKLISKAAASKRFIQPDAEVVILVPSHSALMHRREWRKIYAAFSACSEARIYSGFVSDCEIERTDVPQRVRLIMAPSLEFVSPALMSGLEAFISRGGILITGDDNLFDIDGKSAREISGAKKIDAEFFDVFPLDSNASGESHSRLSQFLANEIDNQGIDTFSWVFDVCCSNIPLQGVPQLRNPDPNIQFDTWMYEHSSNWILPYLNKEL